MTASAITTYRGTFRPGDFVHYRGSVTAARAQLLEIVDIAQSDGRMTLEAAAGEKLRRVRPQSIRPCDTSCTCSLAPTV